MEEGSYGKVFLRASWFLSATGGLAPYSGRPESLFIRKNPVYGCNIGAASMMPDPVSLGGIGRFRHTIVERAGTKPRETLLSPGNGFKDLLGFK
jgi:hypothetical protein